MFFFTVVVDEGEYTIIMFCDAPQYGDGGKPQHEGECSKRGIDISERSTCTTYYIDWDVDLHPQLIRILVNIEAFSRSDSTFFPTSSKCFILQWSTRSIDW